MELILVMLCVYVCFNNPPCGYQHPAKTHSWKHRCEEVEGTVGFGAIGAIVSIGGFRCCGSLI